MKTGDMIGLGLLALLLFFVLKQKPKEQIENAETWHLVRDGRGFLEDIEVHRDVRST